MEHIMCQRHFAKYEQVVKSYMHYNGINIKFENMQNMVSYIYGCRVCYQSIRKSRATVGCYTQHNSKGMVLSCQALKTCIGMRNSSSEYLFLRDKLSLREKWYLRV